VILRELVLHNFGTYRGRQVVDLVPPSRSKPIVLFGGMNGGGKTTLLDGLQLVLYGKLAECSSRRDLSYEEFLRRSINRHCDPRDGAAVELSFDYVTEARKQTYRVTRSWYAAEKSIRERLEVLVDDQLDPLLSEKWSEHVEEIIPSRLAKFFFFDGEKIESMADVGRSSEVLATAVQSLLGLDLVDQLTNDLLIVERRKRAEQRDEASQQAIARAREEVEALDSARLERRQEEAAARNDVAIVRKAFEEANSRFRLVGGEAFERRTQLEADLEKTRARALDAEDELRTDAAGAAPLALILPLLQNIIVHASSSAAHDPAVAAQIAAHDERILRLLQRDGSSKRWLDALSEAMRTDREALASTGGVVVGRDEAEQARTAVRMFEGEMGRKLGASLTHARAARAEAEALERKLTAVPDADAIASVRAERDVRRQELAAAEARLAAVTVAVEEATRIHERKLEAYKRLAEQEVEDHYKQAEAERMVRRSEEVRLALADFRSRVAARHLERIERLVLESFSFLLRKDDLVRELRIDPHTYQLRLLGPDHQELSAERLSAGERQLLAVALIWGLVRASGRPLPVVIDTPLGRLDSSHRTHLVERYFPRASHQVLLLSTDEEIDQRYYDMLRGSVGREYTLQYNPKVSGTIVTSGYFSGKS
jgi:DNA sulfur modification protein DndD